MVFCEKCGTKVSNDALSCKHCGCKLKEVPKETEIHDETHQTVKKNQEPKKDNKSNMSISAEDFIKIVLYFIIFVAVGFVLVIVLMEIFKGSTSGSQIPFVDPCEREFSQCNHACGEGWFSGACKEECSFSYRRCTG